MSTKLQSIVRRLDTLSKEGNIEEITVRLKGVSKADLVLISKHRKLKHHKLKNQELYKLQYNGKLIILQHEEGNK